VRQKDFVAIEEVLGREIVSLLAVHGRVRLTGMSRARLLLTLRTTGSVGLADDLRPLTSGRRRSSRLSDTCVWGIRWRGWKLGIATFGWPHQTVQASPGDWHAVVEPTQWVGDDSKAKHPPIPESLPAV